MAVNGYLKIKTKLDNSGIDKDKAELENKIKKLQTDNSNANQEERALQRQIDKYNQLTQKAEEYKQKMQSLQVMKNGKLEVTDTNQMLNLQAMYSITNEEIEKQAKGIEKVHARLQKVKAKQTENNAKISEFKQKIDKIELNKVQNGIDSVGKKLQNSIGKLGKMTLAIAGIRTAWGAVRGAISMVSQYNPQLEADFEYMRYCIANLLVPAVQWLVNLLYTVLSYVNAIASAWFGINLFSNSSAKNFQKMKNSASGTAKAAKEIQKSLQGFDEMNILQDDGSTSGNAGTGITMPSTDLSKINIDTPGWLQWIIDNGDIVRKILEGIAAAILAIKWNFGLLQGLGLFMIIDGVVSLIKDLKTYLDNPTWGNFAKVMKDIAEVITGLGLVIGVSNPFGLILAIVGQVVSMISGLIGEFEAIGKFIENPSWDNFFQILRNGISSMGFVGDIILWIIDCLGGQAEATKSVEEAQISLETATKNLEEANNSYVNSVDRAESAQNKLEEAERKAGISGATLFKQVQQGVLDYKNMTAEQKEVYKAYLDNETAQKNLKDATDKLSEAKKQEKIASLENKLATLEETEQYNEYKDAVVQAFKSGEISAEEARDLIGKSMTEMSEDSQKTFMEDLPGDIKNGLDPKNYETAGQKIGKWFSKTWDDIVRGAKQFGKKLINTIISSVEGLVNKVIRGVNFVLGTLNKLKIDIPTWVPGIGGNSFGFNIPLAQEVSLPRLAKGGVIAQPTTAVVGEAGKEAIVPLENNMEWLDILADKLASKIGGNSSSYILNIDGRTVQRGLAKRQNQLAFSKNGR